MTNIKVDFMNRTGFIRALHGMNNCDRGALWGDLSEEFKALEIPIVRLHDTGGAYGGSHYVDIPNVFPNFDADPDDPASYDFTLTDYYLKYLVATGCEVMYRLGVTIEHAPKKYHIYPPADFHKWADICEHVVRHYNEGWADGFHFGIKYWEIWNEPDGIDPHITPFGPPMWLGTAEQYYEMYSITANHLKSKHPDIRVGGYSSCRVRGTFRDGKWMDGITDYAEAFFKYITAPETRAPLDFFTWHTYLGHDFYRLIEEARFARDILDRYGFTETENFNTEWNHYLSTDKLKSKNFDGMDALLSTVQMPTGIPVATVAVDGAANAALLAIQMLSIADCELAAKLDNARAEGAKKVLAKNAEIEARFNA